ncbi:MAG: hypothetical protein EOP13_31185 [Pseudomonas sp.]|nr:MAG: hypothetical protein EOP13_31185 [Pseudomonas sp.]
MLYSGPKEGGQPVDARVALRVSVEAPRSALQSCTDEAEAAMLTHQNEGVRGFHVAKRNQWGESWQAVGKN